MKEFIYGLYCDDMDDTIIYVGRAKNPEKRLKQHLNEAKTGASKKCAGLRELLEDGFDINVKVLEEVDTTDVSDAESLWITNIEGAGGVLLNGKAGDVDRIVYIPTGKSGTPWTPEAFEAQWEKGMMGGTTTEFGLYVNGIAFYRTGKTKLRFVHPVYGKHECHGFLWDSMIKRACAYFTEGTVENKRMKG